MRELILHIPDGQLPFFKKLVAQLRDVQLVGTRALPPPPAPAFTAEQQQFVDDLKQSLRDVERHERGEITLQTMRAFLDEN